MVDKFILGTVHFGLDYGINNDVGKISEDDAFRILMISYQNGIRTLDTAGNYGNSEKIIGRFIEKNPEFVWKVISKLKLNAENDFESALEMSLSNLNVECLESLMFHSFSDYIKFKDHLQFFNQRFKGKKYKKLGVSLYTNEEIGVVISDPNIDLIQVPFNLLDNENQRGDVLLKAKNIGKEIHVRSIFLQGLVFMNEAKVPFKLAQLNRYVRNLQLLCKENEFSMLQLAIQYPLTKGYIDQVLFGVDSVAQLKENFKCIEKRIPENIIRFVDNISVKEKELLNPSKW